MKGVRVLLRRGFIRHLSGGLCFEEFYLKYQYNLRFMIVIRGGRNRPLLLLKALGGHRHDIFGLYHFQWESMGIDNGSEEKKSKTPIAHGSR